MPDPRLIAWTIPATLTAARHVTLANVTNKAITDTFAARAYLTPRVFDGPKARFATLLQGTPRSKQNELIAKIAAGIHHPAIPQEEAHHLRITAHHGHVEGTEKCKGNQALCPRCLYNGKREPETAIHKYSTCPDTAQVWREITRTWEHHTGEIISHSALLHITGLRSTPPTLKGQALKWWKDKEPAWRLLHSVTLLQIHKARNLASGACHAIPRRPKPQRAAPKAILKAIQKRFQQRLEHEYAKAKRQPKQMAHFQKNWILTHMAIMRKSGPRANVLSTPPPTHPVKPGVHIQMAAVYIPAKGKQPPAAGWAIVAYDVSDNINRTHTLRLTADGAVPAISTHGAKAPRNAPSKHSKQAANHAALAVALVYTRRLAHQGYHITITLTGGNTHRDLTVNLDQEVDTIDQANPKRRRRTPPSTHSQTERALPHTELREQNRITLATLQNVSLRSPNAAPTLQLLATAQHAARRPDLNAHVRTPNTTRSIPIWHVNPHMSR